jgi:hypothetical protein
VFTNESISVVTVCRDGLIFRCLVGLPLDKGSGNAANHNEIENQQCYLKFQKYVYFQGKWAQKCWPKEWEEMGILKDITFLELFPVVVALCIWGQQ